MVSVKSLLITTLVSSAIATPLKSRSVPDAGADIIEEANVIETRDKASFFPPIPPPNGGNGGGGYGGGGYNGGGYGGGGYGNTGVGVNCSPAEKDRLNQEIRNRERMKDRLDAEIKRREDMKEQLDEQIRQRQNGYH